MRKYLIDRQNKKDSQKRIISIIMIIACPIIGHCAWIWKIETPADFPASFTKPTIEQIEKENKWQIKMEEARLKYINNKK